MVVYVDFSCPYSYAMSERLRAVEDHLDWRLVEHAPGAAVPMAGEASEQELAEVRRAAPEVTLNRPPGLPNSGLASRVFAGLPADGRLPFLHSVFRTLWIEGRDISSPSILEEIAGHPVQPVTTAWQADWEALDIGVPALIRDDGARGLGIAGGEDLAAFLAGRGSGFEGVY